MKIVAATKNKGKIREIRSILKEHEILSLEDVQVDVDVVEDGATFEENAIKKASEIYRHTGLPTLADDSGLEVYALDNRPGIYSARYAGEDATDAQRMEKLLSELKAVPKAQRGARFVAAVALVLSETEVITALGVCEGEIGFAPAGTDGFGYDPLFYVPEKQKTFAQLTADEKNAISHRYRALEALRAKL